MDVHDLKFLFDVIDVKAQSKSMEDPRDANLRRFKDKWLFITTLILILFSFIGWGFFIALRPDSPQLGIVLNGGFGLIMALSGYYVRGKS
jgi:hypothetical protein